MRGLRGPLGLLATVGSGGMNIIERYILRRMFIVFMAASAAALGIVWTVQALAKINLVTDTGQSIGTFLKLASMLLPTVIPIILPFSVLIGITQTLSTMNTDSEMAVIAASGARRGVVFRPTLILAGIASVFLLFVTHVVEPYSRQAVRAMVASANSDLITLAIQEGTFKRIDENLYVQIAARKPDGRLGGIFLADSRDPSVDLIYYARDGVVARKGDTSLLLMNDGEVHRRTLKDGNLSIVRFTGYAFDMSTFTAAANTITLYPKDRSTAYLLNPAADDSLFLNSPQFYRAELHKRFTLWTYPFVFALISLAVAGMVRSHREMRLNGTMTAASVAMGVRWVGLYGEDLAEASMTGVYIVYLAPVAAAAICLWAIWRQETLRLVSIPQRLIALAESWARPLVQSLQRRLHVRPFWRARPQS
jgi:lipopolysaccharide export system permease protein